MLSDNILEMSTLVFQNGVYLARGSRRKEELPSTGRQQWPHTHSGRNHALSEHLKPAQEPHGSYTSHESLLTIYMSCTGISAARKLELSESLHPRICSWNTEPVERAEQLRSGCLTKVLFSLPRLLCIPHPPATSQSSSCLRPCLRPSYRVHLLP